MSVWAVVATVPGRWPVFEVRRAADDFVYLWCRGIQIPVPRNYDTRDLQAVVRALTLMFNARDRNPPRQQVWLVTQHDERWHCKLRCGHTVWKRAKSKPTHVRCEKCKHENSTLDIPSTILYAANQL